jgi:PPOX class probable FMN-dependent enzyme
MTGISTLAELRAHYSAPTSLAARKNLACIDRQARAFIARSSFVVIATANADGWPDASPRGDPPGFVVVENDTTLLMPDRPGNNRVDSFKNLIANPKIGMLFFVPGHQHTLRINGEAHLSSDSALCARFAVNGKPARAVVQVAARQVFFHCGKSLIRSKLWSPEHWPSRDGLATLGQALADQISGVDVGTAESLVAQSIRERLY